MARCDCGAVTARLLTRCTAADGTPLPQPWNTVCPECSPSDFPQERIRSGDDKKLWLMQDVNPNEYESRNGELVLKDWAQGELEARISAPSEDEVRMQEEARERKRRQAAEVRTVLGTRLPENLAEKIETSLRTARAEVALEEMGILL